MRYKQRMPLRHAPRTLKLLTRSSLRAGALALLLPLSVGCERAERASSTPHPAEPVKPAPSVSAAPKPAAPAVAAHPCVVPTPESAPPVALPAAQCPVDPTGPLPMSRGTVQFTDAPGAPRIDAELANTDELRARGLMFRTELPDMEGMLFSWDSERPRSFWMRNTCLPLDMLFIARDGTIVGILEQVPTLNLHSRRVPCPAQFVLEVNAGWTRRHGVKAGQHVSIAG